MQITGLSWCGTRREDAAEVAHFRQRVLGLTPTYTEPDCPGTQARPGSTFEDLMVTATNSSSADTSVPAARALSGHAGLVAPRAQPAELTIPPSAHHDLLCVMQVRKWTSSRTIQNGGSRALGAEQRQSRIVTILHDGKHLPDIRGARSGKQTCGLVPEPPIRSGPCAGCVIRWRARDWLVHGKATSLSRGLTAEAGIR
jgi:hypothetical protein